MYKFLPGVEVLPPLYGSGMFLQKGERDYQRSPLAVRLFTLEGVTAVFLGNDFITITKDKTEDWTPLKPQIFSIIMDAYVWPSPLSPANCQIPRLRASTPPSRLLPAVAAKQDSDNDRRHDCDKNDGHHIDHRRYHRRCQCGVPSLLFTLVAPLPHSPLLPRHPNPDTPGMLRASR